MEVAVTPELLSRLSGHEIHRLREVKKLNLRLCLIDEEGEILSSKTSPRREQSASIKPFFTSLVNLDVYCPTLEHLCASDNRITSMAGMHGLSFLLELNLSHNQLTSIEGIHHLSSLQRLDVSYNFLTELPAGLAQCGALTHLRLSYNSLERCEELFCLRPLRRLRHLHVNENPFIAKSEFKWFISVAEEVKEGVFSSTGGTADHRLEEAVNFWRWPAEVFGDTQEATHLRILWMIPNLVVLDGVEIPPSARLAAVRMYGGGDRSAEAAVRLVIEQHRLQKLKDTFMASRTPIRLSPQPSQATISPPPALSWEELSAVASRGEFTQRLEASFGSPSNHFVEPNTPVSSEQTTSRWLSGQSVFHPISSNDRFTMTTLSASPYSPHSQHATPPRYPPSPWRASHNIESSTKHATESAVMKSPIPRLPNDVSSIVNESVLPDKKYLQENVSESVFGDNEAQFIQHPYMDHSLPGSDIDVSSQVPVRMTSTTAPIPDDAVQFNALTERVEKLASLLVASEEARKEAYDKEKKSAELAALATEHCESLAYQLKSMEGALKTEKERRQSMEADALATERALMSLLQNTLTISSSSQNNSTIAKQITHASRVVNHISDHTTGQLQSDRESDGLFLRDSYEEIPLDEWLDAGDSIRACIPWLRDTCVTALVESGRQRHALEAVENSVSNARQAEESALSEIENLQEKLSNAEEVIRGLQKQNSVLTNRIVSMDNEIASLVCIHQAEENKEVALAKETGLPRFSFFLNAPDTPISVEEEEKALSIALSTDNEEEKSDIGQNSPILSIAEAAARLSRVADEERRRKETTAAILSDPWLTPVVRSAAVVLAEVIAQEILPPQPAFQSSADARQRRDTHDACFIAALRILRGVQEINFDVTPNVTKPQDAIVETDSTSDDNTSSEESYNGQNIQLFAPLKKSMVLSRIILDGQAALHALNESSSASNELISLRRMCRATEMAIRTLEARLTEKQTALKEIDTTTAAWASEMVSRERETVAAEAKLSAAKERLADMESSIAASAERLADAEATLASRYADIETAVSKLSIAREEASAASVTRDELTATIHHLQERRAQEESRLSAATTEALSRLHRATAAAAAATAQTRLTERLSAEAANSLTQQRVDCEAAIVLAEESKRAAESEAETAKDELAMIQQELRSKRSELTAATSALRSAESESKRRRDELSDILQRTVAEESEAKARTAAANRSADEAERRLASIRSSLSDAEHSLNQVTSALNEARKQALEADRRATARQRQADEELASIRQAIAAAEAAAKERSSTFESTAETLDSLSADIRSAERRLAIVQRQVRDAEMHYQSVVSAVRTTEEQHLRIKKDLASAVAAETDALKASEELRSSLLRDTAAASEARKVLVQLLADVDSQKVSNKRLEADAARVRSELAETSSTLTNSRLAVDNERRLINELTARRQRLESEISYLSQSCQDGQHQALQATSTQVAVETATTAAVEKLTRLRGECASQERHLAALKSSIAIANGEKRALDVMASSRAVENDSHQWEIRHHQRELDTLRHLQATASTQPSVLVRGTVAGSSMVGDDYINEAERAFLADTSAAMTTAVKAEVDAAILEDDRRVRELQPPASELEVLNRGLSDTVMEPIFDRDLPNPVRNSRPSSVRFHLPAEDSDSDLSLSVSDSYFQQQRATLASTTSQVMR